MNFKKAVFTTLTLASLGIAITEPAMAGKDKATFILINDDSDIITDKEQVPELREKLLRQLNTLKKKARRYARADLVLISTSKARPVWYGKIKDLGTKRGNEVVERTANVPNRCNQLAASFKAARNTIIQAAARGSTEIHLLVFSSLISTPSIPCNKYMRIDLPQLPVQVDWITSLAPTSQVKSITFYAVNALQHPVYAQSLEPLANWALKNGNKFDIHDFESSINALSYGLEGVKK